jgi:hypothetical protein
VTVALPAGRLRGVSMAGVELSLRQEAVSRVSARIRQAAPVWKRVLIEA